MFHRLINIWTLIINTLRMNDYQKRKKYCQNNQILHIRNSYKYFIVFSIDFLQYSYNGNWVTWGLFIFDLCLHDVKSALFTKPKFGNIGVIYFVCEYTVTYPWQLYYILLLYNTIMLLYHITRFIDVINIVATYI